MVEPSSGKVQVTAAAGIESANVTTAVPLDHGHARPIDICNRVMTMRFQLRGMLFGLALGAVSCAALAAPWVDVDTDALTLTVYTSDGRELARFNDISIGRDGVAALHYHGDESTPRGNYHIVAIRPSPLFGTFMLLDYPRPEHASLAFDAGRIDAATRDAIFNADKEDLMPPQDTVLGGEIGIHGIGHDSLFIHTLYNWTNGCVALTNRQINRLARLVRPGVAVIIH
ncbi:L,D-transpeptidase [Crenobacter sp. SG2305]|uniref:L,D-transpeptidase family protein n=1 Tax=Crenobacter oryzisoli TaxID=3056844 RepID=UPI0025AA58E1|nr:L,D-transpeptidase [Crenobacter sp. SG2305]MDN0085566.1 L,D-transpeptidase [Crenobacter sp. SG2305]